MITRIHTSILQTKRVYKFSNHLPIMRSPYQQEQDTILEKSQFQIKQQYWQKWKGWVQTARKQRYNAVKMLEYQNLLQERLLTKIFKAWVQAHEEEKFEQLLRLKNSLGEYQLWPEEEYQIHQENQYSKPKRQSSKQDDDDFSSYKMSLAIKFHQRKTYAKCIAAWISYGIACNKLQQNISKIYIKFLLKKYFQIIHEFKFKSIDKKRKKALSLINSPKKQELSQNDHPQMNFVTPTNVIRQIEKFPATAQNFRQLLHNNPAFKRNQPQQSQSNTLYAGFQRNTVLGQSRRPQLSTLSNYNSKRKFRPITQLPSIPDLENIQKRLAQNERAVQRQPTKSPIKSYIKQGEQAISFLKKDHSISNLSESNLTQINQNPQARIKQKILDVIVKEKLLTLAIMKGEEFEEGLEYENYREKTVNGLRKLRDVKIR